MTKKRNQFRRTLEIWQQYQQFELDPRDRKLLVPLNPQQLGLISKIVILGTDEIGENYLRSWLVKTFQIIASDSFLKYHRQQLTTSQVRNYFSKNIMLNIYELMQRISQDKVMNDQSLKRLMEFIDEQSLKIIDELIIKYPQSASQKYNRSLRRSLPKNDNVQQGEYDFLYNNKYLKKMGFKFVYKQNKDYSSQIMTVLNNIMAYGNLPIDDQEDSLTNFQGFNNLLNFIFQMSVLGPAISNEFLSELKHEKTKNSYPNSTQVQSLFDVHSARWSKYLQKQREKHLPDYIKKITRKVSQSVKLFTDEEIEAGNFKIPESSLLRIMTKWTEELRNKLKNSKEAIERWVDQFKTTQGKLIDLQYDMRRRLAEAAKKQQIYINQYYLALRKQCLELQGKLSLNKQPGMYSNEMDTNIGIFACRIQSSVGRYMFLYLNELIHSMLRIPIQAGKIYREQNSKEQAVLIESIDLITFTIGDLLRARCISNEDHIIKIISFIETLDDYCPQIIRIVRVKDRYDEKDHDILFNFFFIDQILCEIQFSVAESLNKKVNNYNQFNHLIYQLQRAQFGPIAECACLITQLDPLVKQYSKRQLYLKSEKPINIAKNPANPIIATTQKTIALAKQFCNQCSTFIEISNPQFFQAERFKGRCPKCLRKQLQKKDSWQNLMKDLFIEVYPRVEQLEMIKRHFDFVKTDGIKSIEQLREELIVMGKGLLVMKNRKRPKPQYFQIVQFEQQIHLVVAQDDIRKRKISKSKIILSFKLFSTNQNWREKLNSLYLLKFVQFQQKTKIIFKEQKENRKMFLSCHECCPDIKIYLGYAFGAEKETIKNKNQELILDVITKRKGVLYIPDRNITDELQNLRQPNNLKRLYIFKNDIKKITSNLNLDGLLMLDICKDITIVEQCNLANLEGIQHFSNLKELYCYNNNLESIQPVKNCKNLLTLSCSYNRLKGLQGLENCLHLRILKCSSNCISNLKSIVKCVKMKQLQCKNNQIQSIEELKNLKNIQVFYCNNNKIKRFKGIENWTQLRLLKCESNLIVSLKGIENCGNIKQIQCDTNSLKTLEELKNCKSIQRLTCTENSLKTLKGIEYCENLKQLLCQNNQLQSIKQIKNFTNLTQLFCYNNQLKDIEQTKYCKQLQIINCSQNQLQSLKGIQNCPNLKILICDNNLLKNIGELKYCKKLMVLNIAQNKLQTIQDLSNCKSIRKLYCQRNRIRNLKGVENCIALRQLCCNNNELQSLQQIANCVEIEQLSCFQNNLTNLRGIQKCINLKILNCQNNKIISIKQISQCVNFTHLYCHFNDLQNLDGIQNCKNLQVLFCYNNYLEDRQSIQSLVNLKHIEWEPQKQKYS